MTTYEEAAAGFRTHLPDLASPRFTSAAKQSPYEYAQCMQDKRAPPWLYDLTKVWETLLAEPYKGITSDGTVRDGLFEPRDEGVDVAGAVDKAESLLRGLSEAHTDKVRYEVSTREWRAWSNPEFLLRPFGLRLEEIPEENAAAILAVVQASLSPEGYEKALAAMRVNHFLGEVVNLPRIMNKYSYNFLLFGTPSASASQPWGWLFYGHHLCISCFFRGAQVFLTPSFTGAEPNIIDAGPWAGTQILHKEGALGLQLMQSLTPTQQHTAQIYPTLRDPAMKQVYGLSDNDAAQRHELISDAWGPDDQRHACGAFRDNRIVPYQGVCAASLTPAQKANLLAICEEFLLYHPAPARRLRLALIEKHFAETYFCWTGGFGDADAFYFRVQSPVVLVEFDHHSGVFLTNTEPAKYHTHTICRTPNAGDYGQAVRGEGQRVV